MSLVIDVWTDASCKPSHDGTGTYGVIIRPKFDNETIYYGKLGRAESNEAELKAVLIGLRETVLMYGTGNKINIKLDNQGIIRTIINPKSKRYEGILKEIIEFGLGNEINYNWIKGHSNHYHNNRCDKLAELARLSNNKITEMLLYNSKHTKCFGDCQNIKVKHYNFKKVVPAYPLESALSMVSSLQG